MKDAQTAIITILLLIFGISVFVLVVTAGFNTLVNAYFKNRFLNALKRGEVLEIVKHSHPQVGVSSFDLADYYHVSRIWLLMRLRIAGFSLTHLEYVIYREKNE